MLLSKRRLEPTLKNENENAFDNPEVVIWLVLAFGITIAIAKIYSKIT
jgi:hypothetical protein